ncbi:Peregrin [Orchesella cincta]|uniref:Peregrin n=1 Tax=Orchesella cincta TaxID=48709 RepID=A0A1D2ND03_ORCCI|nr:Peregrin [Orchesella cincta]
MISSPVDTTPVVVQLPPHIVELTAGGVTEQIDVSQTLPCLYPEAAVDELEDVPSSSETSGSPVKSKRGKATPKSSRKLDKAQRLSNKTEITKGTLKSLKQQEELGVRKLPLASFHILSDYEIEEAPPPCSKGYIRYTERPLEEIAEEVEYDLDEEDLAWIAKVNEDRARDGHHPIELNTMELLMDRLEKESYMQNCGMDQGSMIDDDAVCCICMDGECQNSNAILFCDMCNLAVHQECYGVPYIPEGQWLCRRCRESPSVAVDCILCPNKGGAFKKTDTNQWAHVICAIWIPEVCFANTVFLEPIDSVCNIPAARWRLSCIICRKKNAGACIQCFTSKCCTAFHVTCAQQAGLCMRMETVKTSSVKSGFTVKKTAYCDVHAPADFIAERDGAQPDVKQIRKKMAEKRSALPVVSIPTIPPERITEISSAVNFTRKNAFVKRLMSYWKLKRMIRSGVPLLRRLQAASLSTNAHANAITTPSRTMDPAEVEATRKTYAYFTRLRQDLEKSRLLCELIRKREKLKREQINTTCKQVDLKIQPFNHFLSSIVDELISMDSQSIFKQPVDISEVPDYLTVVKTPMDLSTMQEKIFDFQYQTIEDLQADFALMIKNCKLYNSKETVFYRAAVKMEEWGGIVFRESIRQARRIGFDIAAGTLCPKSPSRLDNVPQPKTDQDFIQLVEKVLDDKSRYNYPFLFHLQLLEEALDTCLSINNVNSRVSKYKRIKREMTRLKNANRKGKVRVDKVGELGAEDSPFDLTSDAGEEGDTPTTSAGANSSIRHRLRSVDEDNRVKRRLSRAESGGGLERSRVDGTESRSPLQSLSVSLRRPGRGRPQNLGEVGVEQVLGSSRHPPKNLEVVPVPRHKGESGELAAPGEQTPGGEKESESTPSSRHGSPSRGGGVAGIKARHTRERAVKQSVNNIDSKSLRGRSTSPKGIEHAITAAKTIIGDRPSGEKPGRRRSTINDSKTGITKLRRRSPGAAIGMLSNEVLASPIVRRNSAGKGFVSENLDVEVTSAAAGSAKSSPTKVAAGQRRRGAPRRKRSDTNADSVLLRNGPVVDLELQGHTEQVRPTTNGLPVSTGQKFSGSVNLVLNTLNSPLSPKRRLRGGAINSPDLSMSQV